MWKWLIPAAGLVSQTGVAVQVVRAADPVRGAEVYEGKCLPCHSLTPGQHIVGPSLDRIWNRKSGAIQGFTRYSEVMKKAGVVWNGATLDRFLKDAQAFLPGNTMAFPGIRDDRERPDLLSYLEALGSPGAPFKPPEDEGYLDQPVEIMDRKTNEVYTFDPRGGQLARISYTVSKAGAVRIRLVGRDDTSLVLRTLQNFSSSRYGPVYSVEWDGEDASGNVLDNKNVFVLFESNDRGGRGRADLHARHSPESCRDPELRIVAPGRGALLRGQASVVVAFPESPNGTAGASGDGYPGGSYEGRLYVDYALAAKVRFQKGKEYAFPLDTTKLTNGPHLVTVNMDDCNDHVGTAGIVVQVEQ